MFQPIPIIRGIALVIALMGGSGGSSRAEAVHPANSAAYVMTGCRNFDSGLTDQNALFIVQGLCVGAVSALAFALGKSICAPKGVTKGEQVRAVIDYIDRQPDRLYESFNSLAVEALKTTWPCKW